LEKRLGITIANRGNHFQLSGDERILNSCGELMRALYVLTEKEYITPEMVHLALQEAGIEVILESEPSVIAPVVIKTKHGLIKGRGANQKGYLQQIMSHDINFGIGPAGTGKTYLAVACAVHALQTEQVRKIILVRPAVEAGEKLGFLPGDMAQKVDPYLRPLYDALHEMLGLERVEKLIEKGVIEVAPLAFMRGRTLNNAFIILDEAQNTTLEQIKMFLTRLGFGSTAVITGDITQIDLPNEKMSGLRHVMNILQKVDGISFTFFTVRDVVRHPLVQRIVEAYESFEKEQNEKPLP
jgi:phosphate starvation-inducible PhoH-like protein